MKKGKWAYRLLSLFVCVGIAVLARGTVVNAAAASGILNNGCGGIYIDINADPYTTFQGYSWGQYAYTNEGCAWFASARTNQLTGKGNVVRAGTNWWNGGKGREGFATGQTPAAPALICWQNHVAVLEKIEGNTAYISEGGSKDSNQAHGFCQITTMDVSSIPGHTSGFLGYVYLGNTNPGSLSITASSNYYTDQDVIVYWNTPANTVKCGFTLRRNPSTGDLIDRYVIGNSYNIGKLEAGSYRLWMRPYNAGGTGGTAVYVDFNVSERPATKVTSVSLDKTGLSLQKGESAFLTVSIAPSNAANKSVIWSSSNTSVATVSNGSVQAVGAGSTTITATAADGSGKYASCRVTVTNPHTHSYSAKVTKKATCMSEGVKTYTCSCGSSYTEKIAKTAHTIVTDRAVKATCTKTGKTEGSHCSVCGTVLKAQQKVTKTAHTIVTDRAVKATCTKTGKTEGSHCSVCKTVLKPQQIIQSPKTVKVASCTYNGRQQKPTVTVKDSTGKKISTSTYTVAYRNSKNVGEATAVITFKGKYAGTLTKNFNIRPKTTELTRCALKTKGIQVKWDKQTQITGYELQYSTTEKFEGKNTTTIRNIKKEETSRTLKKLKANKKYYMRIRTYKVVKVNGKNKKLYSNWSEVSTVRWWKIWF